MKRWKNGKQTRHKRWKWRGIWPFTQLISRITVNWTGKWSLLQPTISSLHMSYRNIMSQLEMRTKLDVLMSW